MSDPDVNDDLPVLAGTADPLRPVVEDHAALHMCVDSLATGSGPISIDTERAQTFRYSAKAYLIQVRRAGAGTWLIDPVALEGGAMRADLSELAAVMDDRWLLHAASQDLPCLTEVSMVPKEIFDTELAGRLLGLPRVGLGALVETILGKRLLKQFSAVDWSTRPLPQDWLTYAALDVELLFELQEWLERELHTAGKDDWARQEFEHVVEAYTAPPAPRVDPWRRTSGIHHIRTERAMAVVANLWTARDTLALSLDRAPSKLLPDRLIVEIASLARPGMASLTRATVEGLPTMRRRQYQRHMPLWMDAISRAMDTPKSELPRVRIPPDGPPPVRSWESRNPAASVRWEAARPMVVALADELVVPVENLISPDTLRRVLWSDPPGDWRDALMELGARPWQADLVAPVVEAAVSGA